MKNLIDGGDQNDLNQIQAFKKGALYIRNDMLACFILWCDRKSVRYVSAFFHGGGVGAL